MSQKKVFVSHSSADKEFVRRLVDDLKKQELSDIWFDEQAIRVGDSIPQEIEKGLKNADYVIVVLSSNSVASDWVQIELDATHMSNGTLVLPVLIDHCEIPVLLKARKYADFRQPDDYDTAFQELFAVLSDEQSQLPSLRTQGANNGDVSVCIQELNSMTRSSLRRWITKKQSFDRDKVNP